MDLGRLDDFQLLVVLGILGQRRVEFEVWHRVGCALGIQSAHMTPAAISLGQTRQGEMEDEMGSEGDQLG